MRWDELTGDLFPEAVQKAEGVCLLPLSCIERHGHHLTLATDMLIGREVCNRAAALEPAVVFPDYIFTQILEARHTPGCIGIDPELTIRLLENVCREIARNGLKKIVFVNAHGGNDNLIHYFAQIQLASPRDYVVYITEPTFREADEAAIKALTYYTHDMFPELHEEVKRTVAQGDLVAVHARVVRTAADRNSGRGWAVVDIFRLEHGRIVEHWDVVQDVPEKSANDNTMF